MKWLLHSGQVDSCQTLQNESRIQQDRFELADNMDLEIMFADFEHSQAVKQGKAPKILKKMEVTDPTRTDSKSRLPKLNKRSSSREPMKPNPNKENIENKGNNSVRESKDLSRDVPKDKESKENNMDNLELTGVTVNNNSKGESTNKNNVKSSADFYENLFLKPIPEFANNPEQKQLANMIQSDIIMTNPNVDFSQIVGLKEAQTLLEESLLVPLNQPFLFDDDLVTPWKGVLLQGPPGTGKTMLAKAVATSCNTTFFNVSASTLVSKWRGDSEKIVRVLFTLASHQAPATVFIDEIDSLLGSREEASASGSEHEASRRLKTELMVQIDGLHTNKMSQVFILMASNLPWALDAALLRRLEKRIQVGLPVQKFRFEYIKKMLGHRSNLSDEELDSIAVKTEDQSFSDLKGFCKEAAMVAVRAKIEQMRNNKGSQAIDQSLKMLELEEIEDVLTKVKPAPKFSINKQNEWQKNYGSV